MPLFFAASIGAAENTECNNETKKNSTRQIQTSSLYQQLQTKLTLYKEHYCACTYRLNMQLVCMPCLHGGCVPAGAAHHCSVLHMLHRCVKNPCWPPLKDLHLDGASKLAAGT